MKPGWFVLLAKQNTLNVTSRGRLKRAVLFLLLIGFFQTSVVAPAISAFASLRGYDTADAVEPANAVTRHEIVSERTETTKTYDIGNDTYELVAYSNRVHYKSNGGWNEIDNSIVSASEGKFVYRNQANSFYLRAGASAGDGVRFDYKGAKVELALTDEEANLSAVAKVSSNKVTYSEIYPSVDWVLTVTSNGISNEVIVKSAAGIRASYNFEVRGTDETNIALGKKGKITVSKNGSTLWQTDPSTMVDAEYTSSAVAVTGEELFDITYEAMLVSEIPQGQVTQTQAIEPQMIEKKTPNGKYQYSLTPSASWLSAPGRSFPVRIDPSITIGASLDTFICSTPSPPNQLCNNPGWYNFRGMLIGDYTDYSMPGNPLFDNSHALIDFGTLGLPSNAIVQGGYLSLWHYATNTGYGAVYVAKIDEPWVYNTIWPEPNLYSGNYGSVLFPDYDGQAQERQITIDPVLLEALRSPNNGILVRNVNENLKGVAVCSSDIPSGPCASGDNPQLAVQYTLNQPPNAPNIDYPNEGWALGPSTFGGLPGVVCDTSGTGLGCNVAFRFLTEDPDNTFPPLDTTVRIRSAEGGNSDFVANQGVEGWYTSTGVTLYDGHWMWDAVTMDKYEYGSWSVAKHFIVDTTAPSQPNMDPPEPAFSPGLQNGVSSTASVDNLTGDVRYYFEVSETPDFSVVKETSGWILPNLYTFGNLSDERVYYYRAKARDGLENTSSWGTSTFSTQDATYPLLTSVSLDPQRVSPMNQDGLFDTATLSFNVVENHWDSNLVQILDTGNAVVRDYAGLAQNVSLAVDGKDNSGNWLPDGFYKMKVISKDLAGNTTIDDSMILVIDNSPANISVSSPVDGAWFNYTPIEVSGITEGGALLTIANTTTGEVVNAVVDPMTGIFSEDIGDIPGENAINLHAIDFVGNQSDLDFNTYREDVEPVINVILPDTLISDRTPVLFLDLQDLGYTDPFDTEYISGINPDKTYLSLWDTVDNTELVLVNDGLNIHPELGHISHTCGGVGTFGLSGPVICTYSYIFDAALQPDGEYRIVTTVYDMAGNFTQGQSNFTLDSHTHLVVAEPTNGTLFNYSLVALRGEGERNATLDINGVVDSANFLVDTSSTGGRITVDNCRSSTDPNNDGIREICDWTVADFQLDRDPINPAPVSNLVTYSILDPAGNVAVINHTYLVDLFAVNLSINTDIEFFSPNGDGRQDGIDFIDLSTDGRVDFYEIRVRRQGELDPIRVLSGVSALPTNVIWDGKYNPSDPTADGTVWAEDGDYTYALYIKTTDQIEFETAEVTIYARTMLDSSVVITYPKNDTVTTRGVTNVQGQAPQNTTVRICVDTIGLPSQCDFEFYAEVDGYGSFSMIVPLVRLENQLQTEHYLTAKAVDQYGNETPQSNRVRVVVDTRDPFVSISAIPALTGVNDPEAYQAIRDLLDQGLPVPPELLLELRTVVLRSTVTQNTERVLTSYADWTNLSELPPELQQQYLGYINNENLTRFNEQYDGSDYQPCSSVECTWDFYYPVPPVDGGVYEFEFDGKKGETIEHLYASVMIDGSIPLAPIILDINKIVGGESVNTNLFQNKYYSNSELVEIKGGADPNTTITIKDQNDTTICTTITNSIGIFICTSDISGFYPVDTEAVELTLTAIASDGQNDTPALQNTYLVIDKLAPVITNLFSLQQWHRSGDIAELNVNVNEALWFAYVTTPQNVMYDFTLSTSLVSGIVSFVLPGIAPEGRYATMTTVSDLAGNRTAGTYEFYIDNTRPDQENVSTDSSSVQTSQGDWGEYNGIYAYADLPAAGRLVPEYVIRGGALYLHGKAERYSSVLLYVDGLLVSTILVSESGCVRLAADLITPDGIIVKQGEKCDWLFTYALTLEKGYVFVIKVIDRAGNITQVGEDEIVYYDKTKPQTPEVYNAVSPSYDPIVDWKFNGAKTGAYYPITKGLGVTLRGYGEALSDYEYWVTNPGGTDTDYLFFTNTGNGEHYKTFALGTNSETGDCVTMSGTRRIGICQDGLYSFKVRSTDAPGNGSSDLNFKIERDTVSPVVPTVSLGKQGSIGTEYLTMSIRGEANATALIFVSSNYSSRGLSIKLDGNGNYSANDLIGKLACGEVIYSATVQVQDRAKNISSSVTKTLVTGECPRCGYTGGKLAFPVDDPRAVITSYYKTAKRPDHEGIDIAIAGGYEASWRFPVTAAAPGIVTSVKQQGGVKYGSANYVNIQHDDGVKSTSYWHLDNESENIVNDNSRVNNIANPIGHMGNTGNVWSQYNHPKAGTHLHFAVRVYGHAVNPVNYLGEGPNVVCEVGEVLGEGEIKPSNAAGSYGNEWSDKNGDSLGRAWIKLEVINDYGNVSVYVKDKNIPAPEITYVRTRDNNGTLVLYGIGVYGNMPVDFEVNYKNINWCFIFCDYYGEETLYYTDTLDHVSVTFYEQRFFGDAQIGRIWNGDPSGKWTAEWPLNDKNNFDLNIGDKLYAKTRIWGNTKFTTNGGGEFELDYTTDDNPIQSDKSNVVMIEEYTSAILMDEIHDKFNLDVVDGSSTWTVEELEWLVELLEALPSNLYNHGYINQLIRETGGGNDLAEYQYTTTQDIVVYDSLATFNGFTRYGNITREEGYKISLTHEMAHSYEEFDKVNNAASLLEQFSDISWNDPGNVSSYENWVLDPAAIFTTVDIQNQTITVNDFATDYASNASYEDWAESVAIFVHLRSRFSGGTQILTTKEPVVDTVF